MNLEDLKEEMPFKWRVQTANAYGANCVAFIDARDVQNQLDKVCSPEHWQVKYGVVNGNLFASIGVYSEALEEWVWKSDCGTVSAVEKEKGEASDAFKRAGVMWGIGRFLYSKTIVRLATKEKEAGKGKYIPFIEDKFIYAAEEITRLCNEISEGKPPVVKAKVAPAKAAPAKKPAAKPKMTEVTFDKLMLGSKENMEAALKGYTMSEKSELALNKAIKAYES